MYLYIYGMYGCMYICVYIYILQDSLVSWIRLYYFWHMGVLGWPCPTLVATWCLGWPGSDSGPFWGSGGSLLPLTFLTSSFAASS